LSAGLPCLLSTDQGWKNKTIVTKDFRTTWIDMYCINKQTVDHTVACLDDMTFNLNETIRDFQSTFLTNIIGTGNELWIHDVTDAYEPNQPDPALKCCSW
jgi:hypothetical protein